MGDIFSIDKHDRDAPVSTRRSVDNKMFSCGANIIDCSNREATINLSTRDACLSTIFYNLTKSVMLYLYPENALVNVDS